jgi:hypothetical protein
LDHTKSFQWNACSEELEIDDSSYFKIKRLRDAQEENDESVHVTHSNGGKMEMKRNKKKRKKKKRKWLSLHILLCCEFTGRPLKSR